VRRVTPPNNTWIIIITTPISNQMATGREEECELLFIAAQS